MKKHKDYNDLKTGDIIYFAKNYFVHSKEDGKINCLPLKMSIRKPNDKFYQTLLANIDYTKKVVLDLGEVEIRYLTTLNEDFTNCILETYKSYKKRQEQMKRGAVVLVRGQLHYIYSEEGQNFITFMLHNKPNDNLEQIVINGRLYYINFNRTINIGKKESFDIKNLASDEEMNEIKKLKKKYFEDLDTDDNKKICNIKVCKENLKPGATFKLKYNETDILVVIKVEGKLVTYINENYLDMLLNLQTNTEMKCIDSILDTSKETLERNKEKIKTLMDSYK